RRRLHVPHGGPLHHCRSGRTLPGTSVPQVASVRSRIFGRSPGGLGWVRVPSRPGSILHHFHLWEVVSSGPYPWRLSAKAPEGTFVVLLQGGGPGRLPVDARRRRGLPEGAHGFGEERRVPRELGRPGGVVGQRVLRHL